MDGNKLRELSKLLGHVICLQMVTVQKGLDEHDFWCSKSGIIHELSKHDGLTQVELAAKTNVTLVTISSMLKCMERDEVMVRNHREEDQQTKTIFEKLTDNLHNISC